MHFHHSVLLRLFCKDGQRVSLLNGRHIRRCLRLHHSFNRLSLRRRCRHTWIRVRRLEQICYITRHGKGITIRKRIFHPVIYILALFGRQTCLKTIRNTRRLRGWPARDDISAPIFYSPAIHLQKCGIDEQNAAHGITFQSWLWPRPHLCSENVFR